MTSNAAIRARRLAKPTWGMDGRSLDNYNDLFAEEKELNKTIDWSFNFHWSGKGNWGDHNSQSKQVPNQITETRPIQFYR